MNGEAEPYGAVQLKSTTCATPAVSKGSGRLSNRRGRRNVSPANRSAVAVKVAAILLTAALSATWMIAASVALLHPSLPHPGIGSDGGGPGPARRKFFGGAGVALRDSLRSLGRGAARLEEKAEEMAGETLMRMKRRDMGLAQISGGGFAERSQSHVGAEAVAKPLGGDNAVAPVVGAAPNSDTAGALAPKDGHGLGGDMTTPLLIYTCERADYLRRALNAILKHHPVNKKKEGTYSGDIVGSPIVISQDGENDQVLAVIDEFREKFSAVNVPLFRMQHQREKQGHLRLAAAYKALAVHYGWALGKLFSGEGYQTQVQSSSPPPPPPRRVIILEEDIEVAPDFFSLMAATAPRLDSDDSLLAVSAWNDNGKVGMVGDPRRLVRSDFFPGLGWMMPRRIWDDIGAGWPGGWWDDWIREPDVRKGRHSIRPEVSRTLHFGSEGGASNWNNPFGKEMQKIQLDQKDIVWTEEDLSYLDKHTFRESYYERVMQAKLCNPQQALSMVKSSDVRVEYRNWKQFQKMAKLFKVMGEEKAGVPRSGFENIVDFRPNSSEEHLGNLIFLSPPIGELKQMLAKGRTMEMKEFSQHIRLEIPKKKL